MSALAGITAIALATAAFEKEHPEVLKALEDLVTQGHITKDQATAALRALMVAASDAEMKRELGV